MKLLLLVTLALLAWWLSRDERWRSLPLGDPDTIGDEVLPHYDPRLEWPFDVAVTRSPVWSRETNRRPLLIACSACDWRGEVGTWGQHADAVHGVRA